MAKFPYNGDIKRTKFEIDYHPDNSDTETSQALTRIREKYNLMAIIYDKSKTTLLTAMKDSVLVDELKKKLSGLGIKLLEYN